MKEISLKSTVLFLIICLNWLGLSTIGQTWAYFNDTENSTGNVYSAGFLDFSLINTDIEELIGVELGEDIEFLSIAIKTTGSFDIQYRARAEKMSGSNDDFCDALEMEVFHSQISHDDSLLSFNTATTTAFGTWAFEIELPFTSTHIPHGVECNVDLVFEGWQTDIEDYADGGFTDEERIHLRLTSRMIVLNEFLPYPDGEAYGFDFGNDSSTMPRGEWVELYNNSDSDVDLDGWYIKDADNNTIGITASSTDLASTIIPAGDWIVVYMNEAVLDNDGDTVNLFDANDTLIDSYSYSNHDYCELEPTAGSENSYDASGGSCGDIPSNKSYARIPDGIGTWVDPIPTPGMMNIPEDENAVLVDPTPASSIIEEIIEEIMSIEEDEDSLYEEVEVLVIDEINVEQEPTMEENVEEVVEDIIPVPEIIIEEQSVEAIELFVEEVVEEETVSEFDSVDAFEEIVEDILEIVEDIIPVPEIIIEEQPIEAIELFVEEVVEEEPIEETVVEEVIEEEPVEEIVEQEQPVSEPEEVIIEEEENNEE